MSGQTRLLLCMPIYSELCILPPFCHSQHYYFHHTLALIKVTKITLARFLLSGHHIQELAVHMLFNFSHPYSV